jgi:hypothetical protein
MKKILITAAATLAVAALVGQAQAAPAKSAFCNMPKASNNGYAADLSWSEYYGCWGGHARTAQQGTAPARAPAPSDVAFCNMPKASNNGYAADVSWAQYYHCWGAHR